MEPFLFAGMSIYFVNESVEPNDLDRVMASFYYSHKEQKRYLACQKGPEQGQWR